MANSSGRSPCTNRLISCPNCKDIIWTYNISTHFNNRHPESDKSMFESFPPSREEILAVHNSTNPIKVIEPRKKQASTGRKYKNTIST